MAKANAKPASKPAVQPNTTPPVVSTPEADKAASGAASGAAPQVTATGNDGKDYVIEKLIVVSSIDGFRRAGFAWSKEASEVLVADLTDEQLEMLMNEPKLTVTPVGKAAK